MEKDELKNVEALQVKFLDPIIEEYQAKMYEIDRDYIEFRKKLKRKLIIQLTPIAVGLIAGTIFMLLGIFLRNLFMKAAADISFSFTNVWCIIILILNFAHCRKDKRLLGLNILAIAINLLTFINNTFGLLDKLIRHHI